MPGLPRALDCTGVAETTCSRHASWAPFWLALLKSGAPDKTAVVMIVATTVAMHFASDLDTGARVNDRTAPRRVGAVTTPPTLLLVLFRRSRTFFLSIEWPKDVQKSNHAVRAPTQYHLPRSVMPLKCSSTDLRPRRMSSKARFLVLGRRAAARCRGSFLPLFATENKYKRMDASREQTQKSCRLRNYCTLSVVGDELQFGILRSVSQIDSWPLERTQVDRPQSFRETTSIWPHEAATFSMLPLICPDDSSIKTRPAPPPPTTG